MYDVITLPIAFLQALNGLLLWLYIQPIPVQAEPIDEFRDLIEP